MKGYKNLQEYFVSVMEMPFMGLNSPPLGITISGRTVSVILHRVGQFQTELFIVPPDIEQVEMHTHPNVDSFEMELTGHFDLKVKGERFHATNDNNYELKDRITVNIPHDHVHGGDIKNGASFLSFQHWLNGVKPTSVATDYKLDLDDPGLLSGKKGLDQETLNFYKEQASKY